MQVDQLTLAEIKEIGQLFGFTPNSSQHISRPGPAQSDCEDSAMEIGKNYFIRTATYHCIGRLIKITRCEFVLDQASWIADSGRFHNALKTGALLEVEPYINPVIIFRGCCIDATEWEHALPLEQK